MSENLKEIKKYLEQAVETNFLPHLFSRLDKHREFLSNVSELVNEYENLFNRLGEDKDIEVVNDAADLNKRILAKLEPEFQSSDNDSLLKDLEIFNADIEKLIKETEETRIEPQLRERFYFQQGDKYYIRILKFFKRNFYKISIVPGKIKNVFLKLFKKQVKEINYWKHTIPLHNLREHYFKYGLFNKLLELYETTRTEQTKSLHSLKKYSDKSENRFREKHINLNEESEYLTDFEAIRLPFEDSIELLKVLKDILLTRSKNIIDQVLKEYYGAYIRINTIELPRRKVSKKRLHKSNTENEKVYNRINKGWNNTNFTLAEDWRMDLELYSTRYNLIYECSKTFQVVNNKINNNVRTGFTSISDVIEELSETIKISERKNSEMDEYLIESRNKLKRELTEHLLPKAINNLLNQEIPGNLDELEDTVNKILSGLSDKRALVKTDSYDREIRDSEISYISLRDLISYSSLPDFKSSVLKTKAELSLKLEKIQNSLLEIDQISDFSLESAQIMLKDNSKNVEKAKQIVIEGFERASKKIDEIDDQLTKLGSYFTQKIEEALEKLNSSLINLTYTASILELRLNITKERAIHKSREVKRKIIHKIKDALPLLLTLIKNGYKRVVELYLKVRKAIGLEKEVKIIKGEVSDFLAETKEAINKLPFVYQRLFVVEPVVDERFFFGREEELDKLKTAYNNWLVGKFSPTIIYGEKGSGTTSLLNMFVKEMKIVNSLQRISVNSIVYKEEDLLQLFSHKKEFKTPEELVNYLNNKEAGKKVIIIENLQHMYVRKVNGFENLKILFDLIAETNENVFWMLTCTVYSWRYLQKTIIISDYFANEIEMKRLSDNQIIDIILKRHRVSGYDICYETSKELEKSKNFQRLTDTEKQEKLEKTYFSLLNKFAESNISLALLFWVRSTSSISEDKITIGHLPKIDFSFLSYLSGEKIFTLNLLLIHDGLSEKDLFLIRGTTVERCRRLLTTLEEDGIVVKRKGLFLLNPLLYRPIVEVLKAKNILH